MVRGEKEEFEGEKRKGKKGGGGGSEKNKSSFENFKEETVERAQKEGIMKKGRTYKKILKGERGTGEFI